jgi:hypothetical protein
LAIPGLELACQFRRRQDYGKRLETVAPIIGMHEI